jgi:hypothetical protein
LQRVRLKGSAEQRAERPAKEPAVEILVGRLNGGPSVTCILPSRTRTLSASATRSSGSPLCRSRPLISPWNASWALASYRAYRPAPRNDHPTVSMPQLVIMAMLVDTGDTETGQQVLTRSGTPPAE